MAYIGIVSATDSEQLSPNYIGFQPTTQHPQSAFVVDTFTGNGVQTVFPLSNPKPVTSRALLVSVAGELLVPVNDYGLDSTGNIEFVSAPIAGAYITVHHLIFPKNEATTSIRKLDDISSQFDGVQTLFTLTANGVAASILGQNVLIISIDGVIQEPGIAYTMSGDDIIFSEAPSAVSSFYAVDIGTTGIGTPSDATVSPTKLLTDNNPSTGKVLAVNSSGGLTWATVSGNIGATDLDGLADVSIPTPLLAGQVLRYNGSTFVNAKLDYTDLNGPPTLATVATSGNYNDLTNTPVIPTDIGAFTDVSNLLFNGDYGSLTNLPSIPDKVTELTDTDIVTPANGDVLVWNGLKWINDNLTLSDLGITDGTNGQVLTTDGSGNFSFQTVSGAGGGTSSTDKLTNGSYNFTLEAQGYIKVPTSQYGTAQMFSNAGVNLLLGTLDSGNFWQLKTNGDLVFPDNTTQTTAYTGNYNDLTNKPTLFSGAYADLTGKPSLATVATSGSYNDLTNKPTIPVDVSDLTDTGNLLSGTASILVSTNATGDEGGEIQLAKPPNATLTGGIFFDAYQDRLRIFENGGDYRGVHIDLSKAPTGIAGELMWKKTGYVNAGTYLTLDNIKVSVTTSGNRGLSLGAVSTSFVANIGAWYAVPSGNGGSSANNVTYTTTASSSLFNWQFSTEGDTSTYNIFDKTNNRMYRVTLMIAPSWLNNFICIERLV